MLDLTRCRFARDKEIPLAFGTKLDQEGLALVSLIENGIEVVKPCTGSATEAFVGFSYGEKFTPNIFSKVVEATIPSTGTLNVALPKTNIVEDNIFIFDVTANTPLVEGAVAASGVFVCDDISGFLTFHADQAGHNIRTTFRYYPTVMEVQMDARQFFYRPSGTDFLNQIGVILRGEVFTDIFDAKVNWGSATAVKTASNGLLTDQTGTGAVVNATIINIPNTNNSFLGLRF